MLLEFLGFGPRDMSKAAAARNKAAAKASADAEAKKKDEMEKIDQAWIRQRDRIIQLQVEMRNIQAE